MCVALVIQRAKRMRLIILSSVACLVVPYSSALSHKRHDFRRGGGGEQLNIKSVFWFFLQLLSETFLILRRNQRDMIINIHRSSCEVLVTLVKFLWNFNFHHRFSKNIHTLNFVKICRVAAELFHAHGRTDRQIAMT
jgi:hypothetical protein